MIGIISVYGDLHSHVVAAHLESDFAVKSCFIDTSRIELFDKIRVGLGAEAADVAVSDIFGELVSIGELKACWYRRMTRPALAEDGGLSIEQQTLLSEEFVAAMQGAFDVGFLGEWVSNPHASKIASNKIFQLSVAQAVGLPIPETMVSNDKAIIQEFISNHCGEVIAKPNYGIKGKYIFVNKLEESGLSDAQAITIPAIFQEYIQGSRHLRVNVFGTFCMAYEIESPEIDWRRCLKDCKIGRTYIENEIETKLRGILDRLGLKMGIFDLKVEPSGRTVFLEVNTQGQFLFLDAFSDKNDNLNAFCSYLAGFSKSN